MKMSNFKNPTWQMAAILKIIIFPYLSREYTDTNFDPGDGNVIKIRNGGWMLL